MGVGAQGNLYITDFNRVREIANILPTASFTIATASGVVPLKVSFDASASNDPDGSIVAYAWDFGDGSTGTDKTADHTYAKAGSFTATLKVTDDSGGAATTTRTIIVSATTTTTTTTMPSNGPKLLLGADSPQHVLARKGIRIRASCDEGCSLSATGTVSIAGVRQALTLRPASAKLSAAGLRTLKLRLSTTATTRLRQLLKPGKHARAHDHGASRRQRRQHQHRYAHRDSAALIARRRFAVDRLR